MKKDCVKFRVNRKWNMWYRGNNAKCPESGIYLICPYLISVYTYPLHHCQPPYNNPSYLHPQDLRRTFVLSKPQTHHNTMIPDEFNLSGQELQVLSELDSKQYGFLKLSATENAKKRALVAKVMIFRGWEGVWGNAGEGNGLGVPSPVFKRIVCVS